MKSAFLANIAEIIEFAFGQNGFLSFFVFGPTKLKRILSFHSRDLLQAIRPLLPDGGIRDIKFYKQRSLQLEKAWHTHFGPMSNLALRKTVLALTVYRPR